MKLISRIIPLIFIIGSPLIGSPLQEEMVSSEAQWLLHLDAQRFKDSRIGQYVMTEFVAKNLPEVGPLNLNLQEAVKLIDGVTVYGESMNFEEFEENFDGIALIHAHPDLRAMLEAVMFMAEMQEGEEPPFTVIHEKPYKLVDVGGELNVAFFGDTLIALGKAKTSVEDFANLQAGKRPDLSKNETFQRFALADGTVTVLAAAEGFDELADIPQAKILQMASGFLIRLDENANHLTLDATLTTVDESTASQMRQVMQGILAMAALANFEDIQLSQLLRSAHTETNGSSVNLGLSFPTADLITLLDTMKPVSIEGTDETGGDRLEVGDIKSSVDDRHLSGNVIDGDTVSYWTSAGKEQWIELRFAAPVAVEILELMWLKGNQRQQSFKVQALTEAGAWSDLFEGNSGADLRNLEDINFEFVPIRVTRTKAIRITGNGNTVNDWNSLSEVRINGGKVKPYEVVSVADGQNHPSNLFDTDPETVWDTLGRDVELEGSLDKESVIKEIGIVWSSDGTSSVLLEVSQDSLGWQTVLSVKSPVKGGELQKYNVVDTKGRYFRISPLGDGPWVIPAELVLYGVPANGQ